MGNDSTATTEDKKAPAPKSSWKPYEKGIIAKTIGAETVFSAKFQGQSEPVSLVLNGHGQILDASNRRLIDAAPSEVLLPG